MADARSEKRKILESCIDKLLKDYADAINQSINELGKPSQNQLERQAEDIWERIVVLQNEISQLDLAPPKNFADASKPDVARVQTQIEFMLSGIDFYIIEKTIKRILDNHGTKGCATLMLFQESDERAGEWCAHRIQKVLENGIENTGLFQRIPIEFHPRERLDERAFLNRLQSYLKEPERCEDPKYSSIEDIKHQVLDKLCGSLRNGSIVMIECRKMDSFLKRSEMIDWVLEEFWASFIQKLQQVFGRFYAIRVVMLFFVDATLPKPCLRVDRRCTAKSFSQDKWLEMRLERRWSQETIKLWMSSCPGLSWPVEDIDNVTDTIYHLSEGVPWRVIKNLRNACFAEIGKLIEEN